MSINHFTVIGNITKSLELRYTPNGIPTVTYTVACNQVWYDDAGQSHEECDFVPVTTFGKQAENDARFLTKGAAVAVEGRIQSWYDAAKKRGGFNFRALRVQYLGKSGAARGEGAGAGAQGAAHESAAQGDDQDANTAQDEWTAAYCQTEAQQLAARPGVIGTGAGGPAKSH